VSAVVVVKVRDEGVEFAELAHHELHIHIFLCVEGLDRDQLVLVVGLFTAFHPDPQLADELGPANCQFAVWWGWLTVW
jgi:hypothetical protein